MTPSPIPDLAYNAERARSIAADLARVKNSGNVSPFAPPIVSPVTNAERPTKRAADYAATAARVAFLDRGNASAILMTERELAELLARAFDRGRLVDPPPPQLPKPRTSRIIGAAEWGATKEELADLRRRVELLEDHK